MNPENTPELRCAIGLPHLVAGSDHPHQIGSMDKMLASLHQLTVTETEKTAILGGMLPGCWACNKTRTSLSHMHS